MFPLVHLICDMKKRGIGLLATERVEFPSMDMRKTLVKQEKI